jgi:ABC-2 type transport system permease protein
MLKYVFLAPVPLTAYLIGRGTAGGARALLGAVLVVAAAPLVGIPLSPAGIAWDWLGLFFLLGLVLSIALGLILAGAMLNLARHGSLLSEAVGSVLYLCCGAVFPMAVLPPWVQTVGLWLPPTYWMEGVRRCLLPTAAVREPLLAGLEMSDLAVRLTAGAAILGVTAWAWFRGCLRQAWRQGRLDQTTGY